VTEIPEGVTIKFNKHEIAGYTVVEPRKYVISIDGKEIEISAESYENLKKSFQE